MAFDARTAVNFTVHVEQVDDIWCAVTMRGTRSGIIARQVCYASWLHVMWTFAMLWMRGADQLARQSTDMEGPFDCRDDVSACINRKRKARTRGRS